MLGSSCTGPQRTATRAPSATETFDPAGHAGNNLSTASADTPAQAGCSPPSSYASRSAPLLADTATVTLAPDQPAEWEVAPVGGWARVPVLLD